MDNLKKYLQDNKLKMDVDAPRDAVWETIKQKTTAKKQDAIAVKLAVRYLAAACVFFCIATIFFRSNKNKKTNAETIANKTKDTGLKPEATTAAQPKETDRIVEKKLGEKVATAKVKNMPSKKYQLAITQPQKGKITIRQITIDPSQLLVQDIEKNYVQLVGMQLERLRATPIYAESPHYFTTFKQQLKQIEANETAIKKDIRLHGLNDELLQQLINTNQQKLNVLKELQAEIIKLNNKVEQFEPRPDSSHSFFLTM